MPVRQSPPLNPPEVRTEAVRVVFEGGVSIKLAAATVGSSEPDPSQRNWVFKPTERWRRPDGSTNDELVQFLRRVRTLEEEREIRK
jgi:transposase-like protein